MGPTRCDRSWVSTIKLLWIKCLQKCYIWLIHIGYFWFFYILVLFVFAKIEKLIEMFKLLCRYQFPPMDSIWHKILGLVMIVLGLMGWIGNSVVVYVFLMTSSLRTPSNFLVVNLVFSDFMMIMSPPMVINCYYETWILSIIENEICLLFTSFFFSLH